MRFGIFYEHQMPAAVGRGRRGALLNDALDQVELADRVGIDYVWEVEHHFLEEYSHSSAPEVFLAAASQRTKHIRLGHGIVQIPPGFNHPARVAERIATLDLISGGRVEFGTGESSSQAELGGVRRRPRGQARAVGGGARRDHAHVRGGAVRRLRRPVHLDAAAQRCCRSPSRSRTRRCGSRAAAARRSCWRAQAGIGALTFAFIEPEAGEGMGRRVLRDSSPPTSACPAGFAVNPNFAVVLPMMLHTGRGDGDRARHRRRALLRLLARALLRVRRPPSRASRTSGRSSRPSAPSYGFAREIINAGRRPAGREDPAAGPRLAARRDRHAGAGGRAGRALRARRAWTR